MIGIRIKKSHPVINDFASNTPHLRPSSGQKRGHFEAKKGGQKRGQSCPVFARERLSFCPAPNVAYTKWLVKYVLALRREMSITAVAKFTGLHWESVKEIEKRYLTKKYAKVRLVDRKFNWLIGNSIVPI